MTNLGKTGFTSRFRAHAGEMGAHQSWSSVCLLVAALLSFWGGGPAAQAETLMWDTTDGIASRPSATSLSVLDLGGDLSQEVADDFFMDGEISRVTFVGTLCFPCEVPVVEGVVVRFYERRNGKPGELLAGYQIDGDDPGFIYDPSSPTTLDIALPEPFVAEGRRYFVGVQLVVSEGPAWSIWQANEDEFVFSQVYLRDRGGADVWVKDPILPSQPITDFAFSLHGAGPPTVLRLSTGVSTPSGRFIVFGSGFGGTRDEVTVLVDGVPAIVTRALGNRVHAYVPEQTEPGTVQVQVITEGGESALVSIEIRPRTATPPRQWSFQTDRWMNGDNQYTGIAADGTIYTSDAIGLYALSPDGGLLWFTEGVGNGRPIDIGPDGTLYTGLRPKGTEPEGVVALSSAGEVLWEYTPPGVDDLGAGPNLGPDGNLYAIQRTTFSDQDLGAFSLDTEGNLRWSNRMDGQVFQGLLPSNFDIAFADDRIYAGVAGFSSSTFHALTFGGEYLWNSFPDLLPVVVLGRVQADPSGRAIANFGSTGVVAVHPEGEVDWFEVGPGQQSVVNPVVDTAGRIYTSSEFGAGLYSLSPAGETLWLLPEDGAVLNDLGVSADGTRILATGGGAFGLDGWVRVYDATNGAFLAETVLPTLPGCFGFGCPQFSTGPRPAFGPDGTTGYVTTSHTDTVAYKYGWLHAFSLDTP